MAINYQGGMLQMPKTTGVDWMSVANSQASPVASVGGGALSGALAGLPLGPIGAIGGGLLGAIGSGINAFSENKRQKEALAYQKKKDAQDQKNTERGLGMNALSLMSDNYTKALLRARRGY